MSRDELDRLYRARHRSVLEPLARLLQTHLAGNLSGLPRIDRVTARAKNPSRFLDKAMKTGEDGKLKYGDPLDEIQDQVGARIVVFYLSDVDAVAAAIETYHRHIEARELIPDSPNEFGYVGKHYVLAMPEDVVADDAERSAVPRFFELQVKTLFQHAWSEAEHDLAYKAAAPLSIDQKRRIAFTAAQAWGADHLFDQLHGELGASASGA